MDAERWNHVDKLLQSALDRPAAERDVFCGRACGGDEELEHEVRSLLAAHDRADSFLGAPAIEVAARELAAAAAATTLEPGRSADRPDPLALPHRREAGRRRDGRRLQSRGHAPRALRRR